MLNKIDKYEILENLETFLNTRFIQFTYIPLDKWKCIDLTCPPLNPC